MNKALFIMLEKTLITTKSGKSFPLHSEDWKFTTNFYDLFKNATDKGYEIIILSEELGIGEGMVNENSFIKKLEDICKIIEKELKLKPNTISYEYCKDTADEFRTIRYPGMLYEVALDKEILLTQSVLVGNSEEHKAFSFIGGIASYYDLHELTYIKL